MSLCVLQHRNRFAMEIDLKESLRPGQVGGAHPNAAIVGSPIDAHDSCPAVELQGTLRAGADREDLNLAGKLALPPGRAGQHGAVAGKRPVEFEFTRARELRKFAFLTGDRVKAEEPDGMGFISA